MKHPKQKKADQALRDWQRKQQAEEERENAAQEKQRQAAAIRMAAGDTFRRRVRAERPIFEDEGLKRSSAADRLPEKSSGEVNH